VNGNKFHIWRMTHYTNIAFILRNGLHCCNCELQDDQFTGIGFKTLISRRSDRKVTIEPGGILNDYIPFYFHYKMPMLYKIYSGEVADFNGSQKDIVYIVSSVEKIIELGLPYIFTDRHAALLYGDFYNKFEDLNKLSWDIIRDDTWFYSYTQIRKEKKQAEFLIHKYLPVAGILGIVAMNAEVATFVQKEINIADLNVKVIERPQYYYP
jgi:hypothetical protein